MSATNPELERIAQNVTSARLAAFLERTSWRQYGGREGLYSKWRLPEGRARIILPLDPERDDYFELIREALYSLANYSDDPFGIVRSLDLRVRRDDELKFRKDVPTIAGAVAWPVGHGIVQAAQDALLAAAKAQVAKRAYYGNASGKFAHRFLDACLMGQTEIGSYVVTAYAPADEYFPEKEPRTDVPALQIAGYTGRDIARTLVGALRATGEAIEHYQASASLSGFEEGVRKGVSKEMTSAVRSLILGSDGAEVRVEWSPSTQTVGGREDFKAVAIEEVIGFEGSAVPVLERAVSRLAAMTPSAYVRASGWVRVVARPRRGEPGIITITVMHGSEAKTLKVRLTDEQFEIAAQAISQERGLAVSGRQEREGRTYWLYDASDLQLLQPAPAERPGGTSVQGQAALPEV